jgi:hypothetical protein
MFCAGDQLAGRKVYAHFLTARKELAEPVPRLAKLQVPCTAQVKETFIEVKEMPGNFELDSLVSRET